ncbi:hypothetical protein SLW70_06635 [Flavobacterium sp. NG2]|uniref:hypothetical protein n=1 Tax=Flavobacterium sp. NG2 TaxID=3097547 RepID=UPI002A82D43D|nr:hypothetical protein [Flavobacterium sp. NG2]WPR72798.1 hypothetical protein SLW70_06635 [Flavobacterium sp. NG2]
MLSVQSVYCQSRTEKSKEELTQKSSTRDSYRYSIANSSAERGFFSVIFVDIFEFIFIESLKATFIGDYNNENHLYNSISKYPYYNENTIGNYTNRDSITKTRCRLDLENRIFYNTNNLYGNHVKVKLRPIKYFYIEGNLRHLFEKNRISNYTSTLFVSDFAICYDRIRMEKFDLGWRIGATYIGNEVRKMGFAYGINANYFLNNTISFSGSAKWSAINFEPVNSYELVSVFNRKKYFFSFGYEHLKIATPTYDFVTFGLGTYF